MFLRKGTKDTERRQKPTKYATIAVWSGEDKSALDGKVGLRKKTSGLSPYDPLPIKSGRCLDSATYPPLALHSDAKSGNPKDFELDKEEQDIFDRLVSQGDESEETRDPSRLTLELRTAGSAVLSFYSAHF